MDGFRRPDRREVAVPLVGEDDVFIPQNPLGAGGDRRALPWGASIKSQLK